MSHLKLVVFDCDGVMFDSLGANRQYYNHILAKFGHPGMDADELKYVHAHHVVDSVRYIYRKYPADYEKADQYRQNLDYTPFLKYMLMEPDLKEFLEYLIPEYKTAISTNRSTTMQSVLDIFGLTQYYEMVVTALDVKNPKPHPEALHRILEYFKVSVNEAIYIGDSHIDLEHTAAVGMPMIAFKNRELKAAYHVSSFMEITELPVFTYKKV